MANFALRRGHRYRATVSLGFVERLASNDVVAEKFRAAGFDDVQVTGSGATRYAEGVWTAEDVTPPMPSQVADVNEIA